MLYIVLFAQHPFADKHKVLQEVQFPPKPQVSANVKDLILRMVSRDPEARIKLDVICSHAWISPVLALFDLPLIEICPTILFVLMPS